MADILHLTSDDFHDTVNNSDVPVFVDFWAQWCGPCKMFAPVFEELADDFNGKIQFAKVNIDIAQAIAVENNVRAIPTLLLFKGGEVVLGLEGSSNKEALREKLESCL
jgi:thioredoxin 1